MTLQQVLYALTIQECGSMNKAAEKLYIVQPTLTSAIQELENEVFLVVGVLIFVYHYDVIHLHKRALFYPIRIICYSGIHLFLWQLPYLHPWQV